MTKWKKIKMLGHSMEYREFLSTNRYEVYFNGKIYGPANWKLIKKEIKNSMTPNTTVNCIGDAIIGTKDF